VPSTGFEPVVSALRGRCPRPLDDEGLRAIIPVSRFNFPPTFIGAFHGALTPGPGRPYRPASYMLWGLTRNPSTPEGPLSVEPAEQRPRQRKINRRFVDSALQSQEVLRDLVRRRKRLGLSQTEVAIRMGTSQSAIARIETAGMDIRLSTLERYAAAIGHKVDFKLTRVPPAKRTPARAAGLSNAGSG
jgi:DNA-binding XRE family transcriptional regulator